MARALTPSLSPRPVHRLRTLGQLDRLASSEAPLVVRGWARRSDLLIEASRPFADQFEGDAARLAGRRWLVGDPAGVNRESNQESWISNLNRCGVPVSALDPWYNSDCGIRKTFEDFQQLLDMGKLRVHRKRAGIFWDAIEGWQFKAPEGVPLQLLELARLKPRKDRHSHPGDTGRYGAGAIRRLLRRPGSRADNDVEILSRLLTERSELHRLPPRHLYRPLSCGVGRPMTADSTIVINPNSSHEGLIGFRAWMYLTGQDLGGRVST